MFKDDVSSVDKVVAGLSSYAPPRFPCQVCGKETKEHTPGDDGSLRRICSMPACRSICVSQPAEG